VTTTSTVPTAPSRLVASAVSNASAIALPCVSGVAAHARLSGSTWSRWPAGTAWRMATAAPPVYVSADSICGREGVDVGVAEFLNDSDDGVGESAHVKNSRAVWAEGVGER